jgi:hypothetical protein
LKLKLCLPATPTGTKCTLMTEQQFARESVDVTSRLDMPTLDVVEQLQSACAAAGAEEKNSRSCECLSRTPFHGGGYCQAGRMLWRADDSKPSSNSLHQGCFASPEADEVAASVGSAQPPADEGAGGRQGFGPRSTLTARHAHVPHLITSHDIPVPPKPL